MLKSYSKTNSSFYIFVVLISFTFLSRIMLNSSTVSADDSIVDQVTINVPVSCSMTGTGMNSHTAEITNGTYTADIGTTTLKAYCNDSNGFSIYTIGYTNDTYGTTTLIGQSTSNTIVTGTATSAGNPDTSNWAMKLTAVSSPTPTYPITLDNGYGSYSIVPSTYTKVAHRDSGTDIGTNAEGSTLTTTYAAYISRTQPADTYEGKVKYTLVHPADNTPKDGPMECSAGYICYSPNANDVLGAMMYQYVGNKSSITLDPSNYSRSGYGFAGWSTTPDYSDPAGFYGPMETIITPADTSTNGLSLYAIWVKSAGSLQGWTGCSSLNIGAVTALTDQRDNDTYAVAKLADGKCWMIENLRLDNTGTNNTTGTLAQGYNSSFIGLANPEAPWANNNTAANSLYTTETGVSGKQTISGSNLDYRFPRYNNQNTNSRVDLADPDIDINIYAYENIYSYGNYYTWSAAIADTTDYASGNHSNASICPTGWQIPLGDDSTGDIEQGEADVANNVPGFSYLDRKMGGTGTSQFTAAASLRWRKYPVNFVYSGSIYSDYVERRGSDGYYWSSTAGSPIHAYGWILSGSNVASSYLYKYYGKAVRCVASGL